MCLTGARTASLIPLKAFKMLNPKLYLMAFVSILFLIKLVIIKSQFSFSFLFYFVTLPFFSLYQIKSLQNKLSSILLVNSVIYHHQSSIFFALSTFSGSLVFSSLDFYTFFLASLLFLVLFDPTYLSFFFSSYFYSLSS